MGAAEAYLVGVEGVGSTIVLGTTVAVSFVLVMCFFFVGVSSNVVMPGIVILVGNRSKQMLLDNEIMLAGAVR